MRNKIFAGLAFVVFSQSGLSKTPPKPPVLVQATAKTEDVKTAGDAADDAAIYVNHLRPSQSLIFGTDKNSGLSVFDLSGKRIQEFPDGEQNNVDLRYKFSLGKQKITIIGAGNRTANTMDFYSVNEKTNQVERLSVKEHPAGLNIYGSCFYQGSSKKLYFFVNGKKGEVVQWELSDNKGKIAVKEVRRFDLGSQVEGCVADDDYQNFYIGEEKVGIWQYGAEPTSGETRKLIDSTNEKGHLVADVEGLALYKIGKKQGYLLASSQGENAFNVYHRKDGAYVGKFQVSFQGKMVEDCDGIEVSNNFLNNNYPLGLIVVQDGNPLHERQSFKLVPWHKLARAFSPPLGVTPRSH